MVEKWEVIFSDLQEVIQQRKRARKGHRVEFSESQDDSENQSRASTITSNRGGATSSTRNNSQSSSSSATQQGYGGQSSANNDRSPDESTSSRSRGNAFTTVTQRYTPADSHSNHQSSQRSPPPTSTPSQRFLKKVTDPELTALVDVPVPNFIKAKCSQEERAFYDETAIIGPDRVPI